MREIKTSYIGVVLNKYMHQQLNAREVGSSHVKFAK